MYWDWRRVRSAFALTSPLAVAIGISGCGSADDAGFRSRGPGASGGSSGAAAGGMSGGGVGGFSQGGTGGLGPAGAGGFIPGVGGFFAGGAQGSGGQAGSGGFVGSGGAPGTGGGVTVCPGGMGAVESMRIKEVFIGNGDYLILQNAHASCPANISGMVLSLQWVGTGNGTDVTLPSLTLAPGETVLVTEGTPQFGQIQTSVNINFGGAANPAYAMLCTGLCTTSGGGSVVDLMSFMTGTNAPPALPSPLTFTPLSGITESTENTQAYVHVGSTGSYPAFQSTDWTVAPATHTGTASCPALPPRAGLCATTATCPYGSMSCTCNILLLSWSCS